MHGEGRMHASGGQPAWLSWLQLWILVALWGSAFGLVSLALEQLPTATIVSLRLVLGAAVLLALFALGGGRFTRHPRAWFHFALIAVLGNCIPFYLITWGQQQVSSGMAGILMSVTPLVVVGLAHWFLPGERANPGKMAGILAGFLGIWLLLSPSGQVEQGGPDFFWRQIGVLAGAVCYGITIIIARRQPVQEPLQSGAAVLSISALLMLAPGLAAMPQGDWAGLSWQTVAIVLVLGLLCTGYATVVYFQLVRGAGATFLSLINYLIPLWAVMAGAIFLGERLTWSAWLAMLIVLLGVGLAGRRSQDPGSANPPAAKT